MSRPSFQRKMPPNDRARARRLVPVQGEQHAADQMHHQVSGYAGARNLSSSASEQTSLDLKAILGVSFSQVSQARFSGERSRAEDIPRRPSDCCGLESIRPT